MVCFFFSLASSNTLERFRQACVSVRDSQRGVPVSEEAGAWQSVRALDCIHMPGHVSPSSPTVRMHVVSADGRMQNRTGLTVIGYEVTLELTCRANTTVDSCISRKAQLLALGNRHMRLWPRCSKPMQSLVVKTSLCSFVSDVEGLLHYNGRLRAIAGHRDSVTGSSSASHIRSFAEVTQLDALGHITLPRHCIFSP